MRNFLDRKSKRQSNTDIKTAMQRHINIIPFQLIMIIAVSILTENGQMHAWVKNFCFDHDVACYTDDSLKTLCVFRQKVFVLGNGSSGGIDINYRMPSEDVQLLPSFDSIIQHLDEPAGIMFSGGTTGLQKAIALSHRNIQSEYALGR